MNTFTGFAGPIGLALDTAGNVYAANYTTNNVVRVTPANVATPYVTGLAGPHAIAFDPTGALYIDDYATGRLLRVPVAPAALPLTARRRSAPRTHAPPG